MVRMKILMACLAIAMAAGAATLAWWAHRPILDAAQPPIEFAISGSGAQSSAKQIATAGIPVNPLLLSTLIHVIRKNNRLKPGIYELKAGVTPLGLIDQMARGAYLMQSITIIEGWTFRQMRQAIDKHPGLRHDTPKLSDAALLKSIGSDFTMPEGLFFPETYRFAKGSSDLQVYRQAHALMRKNLDAAWAAHDRSLPYKNAYDALIMASIVEKETGRSADRAKVASVFVNRLKRGMPLQTDPTVIYGMGDRYRGKIHKRDLAMDTPYNTYTRGGLPRTPISLPGMQSLLAALHPEASNALYFVARGDGSSTFTTNLADHNRAVKMYLSSR